MGMRIRIKKGTSEQSTEVYRFSNHDHYLLHIKFDKDDEPEIVIRVLSFGPTVEVLGSENFKQLIINKLKSQKSCELL